MVPAIEVVRERLQRGASALEGAGISHTVIGGNAVYLWLEQHGEGGERFTPNVDFLVCRTELNVVKAALERVGFHPDPERQDLLRDGLNSSPRTRLRLLFAGEKARKSDVLSNPDIICSEHIGSLQVLALTALV